MVAIDESGQNDTASGIDGANRKTFLVRGDPPDNIGIAAYLYDDIAFDINTSVMNLSLRGIHRQQYFSVFNSGPLQFIESLLPTCAGLSSARPLSPKRNARYIGERCSSISSKVNSWR